MSKRLTTLEAKAAELENELKEVRKQIEIENERENDGRAIEVAGIRWARHNLGVSIDHPHGKYYTWDHAQKACPKGWRLPTKEEFQQLIDRTTSEWTQRDGMNGRLFTDKETGATLWYPASGSRNRSSGAFGSIGAEGDSWSASDYPLSQNAYYMYFNSSVVSSASTASRAYGLPVRCVQE